MNVDYLDSLIEERAKLWKETIDGLETARGEKREMTGDEEARYSAQSAKLDELDGDIAKLNDLNKRAKAADEARAQLQPIISASVEVARPSYADMFRSLANGEMRGFNIDMRALSVGTTTAGGHSVPTGFENQLAQHLEDMTSLRKAGATVIRTASGEAIEFPKTTDHGDSEGIVAENTAITGTDPAFGKMTLNSYKYPQLIAVSNELLADSGVDLEGYIANAMGKNIGRASNAHYTTGDGSSKPNGIVTASTLGKTAAGAETVTFDELIDLQESVSDEYRELTTCRWMMASGTAAIVRKLQDGNGQYLWQPAVVAGQPDMLLGNEVVRNASMPAATTGLKSILFGDFSQYYIRDVADIQVAVSTEVKFAEDQTVFRAILRTDGDLIDQTGAVKHLIQA